MFVPAGVEPVVPIDLGSHLQRGHTTSRQQSRTLRSLVALPSRHAAPRLKRGKRPRAALPTRWQLLMASVAPAPSAISCRRQRPIAGRGDSCDRAAPRASA